LIDLTIPRDIQK